MAKTTTIEEVKDKEQFTADDIIKRMSVKITKLFPAKKGGEGAKAWEIQNGEIMDATGKIDVMFSNNTQPMSAKGKEVVMEAVHGDHGWNGVKVDDNEYDDKQTGEHIKNRRVKVTSTANIVYESNGASEPAEERRSKPRGETTTTYDKGPVRSVKERYGDILALYKQCYSDIQGIDTELDKNPQALCAAVATVFIECNKQSLSFDFQSKYMEKPKPPQESKSPEEPKKEESSEKPKEPAKEKGWWKHVVVPRGEYKDKTLEEIPEEKLKEIYEAYLNSEDGFSTSFAKAVKAAHRARLEDSIPM